jgi:hypothetical protein
MSVIWLPRWEVDQLEQILFPTDSSRSSSFMSSTAPSPNFRFFTAALGPPSGALGRQLDPHPEIGRAPISSATLRDRLQLAHLLQHDVTLVPDPLPHEGEAHELSSL